MFRWAPYAMVRITLCLMVGVLLGIHSRLLPQTFVTFLAGSFFLIFTAGYLFKYRPVAGFGGLALVALSGYSLVRERTASLRDHHIVNCIGEATAYQLVVSSFSEERENSIRTYGEVQAILLASGWKRSSGTVLLYIPKRDSVKYYYGDVLLVKGKPRQIPPPVNPGAFDFRQYMAYKGIHFQDIIPASRVSVMRNEPQNLFISNAIMLRSWAEEKIKSVVLGEREQATAVALVLGVTDGLDDELLQAYASTGALHVLAVSGLHVSIIYWIILILLTPLDKSRGLKWLIAFISVFVLWSYAFVSGWSPSVLRAVTMFSFVAIARPWRQSTNIFNTLAASMFCLLLYEPYFIMSVGFQLSYLAVFGIVYLQPKFYSLWEPRTRILDEIWKVSSVSLAAQIATLPIGLFYFHQFPTYFLPANLVVIPVSFVVLVVGLAIGVFAFFDPLIQALGWIQTWAIRLMNGTVIAFEQLPFSVIDGIYISQLQCLLIAILIIATILVFDQKRIGWLFIGLSVAVALSLTQWHRNFAVNNSAVFRIYNIRGSSIVDHIAHRESRILSDSTYNETIVRRFLFSSWLVDGVRHSSQLPAPRILTGHGIRMWMWNRSPIMQIVERDHKLPKGLVRFIVISNNAVLSLQELREVKCEKIIVDSSNSFYFAERLRIEAEKSGLSFWSVLHDGAFEYKYVAR